MRDVGRRMEDVDGCRVCRKSEVGCWVQDVACNPSPDSNPDPTPAMGLGLALSLALTRTPTQTVAMTPTLSMPPPLASSYILHPTSYFVRPACTSYILLRPPP